MIDHTPHNAEGELARRLERFLRASADAGGDHAARTLAESVAIGAEVALLVELGLESVAAGQLEAAAYRAEVRRRGCRQAAAYLAGFEGVERLT